MITAAADSGPQAPTVSESESVTEPESDALAPGTVTAGRPGAVMVQLHTNP
jgi:hypothetical protein